VQEILLARAERQKEKNCKEVGMNELSENQGHPVKSSVGVEGEGNTSAMGRKDKTGGKKESERKFLIFGSNDMCVEREEG